MSKRFSTLSSGLKVNRFLLSALFLFIFSFFSFNLVSGDVLGNSNTYQAVPDRLDSGYSSDGQLFINDGMIIKQFHNDTFMYLKSYILSTPLDLTTISEEYQVNLSVTQASRLMTSSADGYNLYFIYNFDTTHNKIFHYTMDYNSSISRIDLRTLKFIDSGLITIPTNLYNDGFAISSNGGYLYTIGFTDFGVNCKRIIKAYSLGIKYNLSSITQTNSFQFPTGSCDDSLDIGFRNIFFSNDGFYLFGTSGIMSARTNLYVVQYSMQQPYNISSLVKVSSINLPQSTYASHNYYNYFYLSPYLDKTYWFVNDYQLSDGNTIRRNYFGSLDILETVNNQTITQSAINTVINKFLGIFPEPESLTFKEKIGWVFITMILVTFILLLAGGSIQHGVSALLLYIIVFLDIGLFLMFIALGYISIVILIIMILASLVIAYFKFKGSGGN